MEPDDYKIDITTMGTITIDSWDTGSIGNITFNSKTGNSYVYGIDDTWIDIDQIITSSVVFEDRMPDIKEIEDMCKEYPGLEKAYENFKTFYKLVEQDWRGKQKENK
jgi:hypothetical protein